MERLLYKELSYSIQGAFFTVYKKLGNAYKESIYQKALGKEFECRELKFDGQKRINVYYENEKVGTYVPDFIVEQLILIELKSKPKLLPLDSQQFWHYLRGSEFKVGYLVNFGSFKKVEYLRRIYDTARVRNKNNNRELEN